MEDNIHIYRTRVFKKSDTFPDDFIKKCEDNANEAINIPIDAKNNINRMATEQGLYARVFNISQNYLRFIAENNN